MNEYTDITEYYDLLMTSGYYDYHKIAKSFHSVLGERKKLLEVGVGTGLLTEELLKIDDSYELTGIDHTESMLKIARERLGNQAKLIQANLVSMELGDTFDAVISNGVWAMADTGKEYHLGTHLPDDEENLRALKNVAKHLNKNGLFLLNIQKPHYEYELPLPQGIVYCQEVSTIEEKSDQYSVRKSYIFKKEGQILAKQTCTYKLLTEPAIQKIMDEAGFKFQEVHPSQDLYCYFKY